MALDILDILLRSFQAAGNGEQRPRKEEGDRLAAALFSVVQAPIS
jgi:hypothetical protein